MPVLVGEQALIDLSRVLEELPLVASVLPQDLLQTLRHASSPLVPRGRGGIDGGGGLCSGKAFDYIVLMACPIELHHVDMWRCLCVLTGIPGPPSGVCSVSVKFKYQLGSPIPASW